MMNNQLETITKSKELNRFRKLKTKLKFLEADIKFLKDCRNRRIFPDFIKVYTSVDNSRTRQATLIFKKTWLDLEIRHHYARNESINKELYSLNLRILNNLSNIQFEIWIQFKQETDEIVSHKFSMKRRNQNKKLQRILDRDKTNNTNDQPLQSDPEFIDDFFVNESSQVFSETEEKLLNKGLNFIPKPSRPPTLNIVADIESAIKKVPFQERDEIRQECSKVLKAEIKNEKSIDDHRRTIKNLKEKDVYYLKADKSNSIVAIDVSDYNQRMIDLITEGPYDEINNNPLNRMTNSVKSTLNFIKSKFKTTFDAKFTVSNPKIPRLYGLPKTHKPGNKMRPIVSNNDAPTEKIAKWINERFEELPTPIGLYVNNTLEALDHLKDMSIAEDECLVSFDVTALFPNVPIDLTLTLLKRWLKLHITENNTINAYVELAKLCMQENFFQFNGHFYKQNFGTSMGNALSPFMANLFMADLETRLSKLKIFPRVWLRYVDDIFCIAKRNTIDRLLVIMNRRHATIKFTHEIEEDGALCFLDTKIKRKLDGSLEFEIFRKPTSTTRYITSDSQHSSQHKAAAFNSMLNRICTYPISDDHRAEEIETIKKIAKVNGYGEKFIDQMYQHHLKKKQLRELTTLTPVSDEQTIKRVAVPFHPPITNKLQGVFKKHQIKMVHSTRGKLGELLGNPKDQVETLQKSGIYKIDCLGCSASYIGQSRRSITTRFNDHHRNIRKNHPELSSVADHVISHMNEPRSKHDINLDNFTLLKEVRRPDHLDAFESYYILKAKKEGQVLLNNDDGNVNSTLLLNLAL
jgi:hypothetical protein